MSQALLTYTGFRTNTALTVDAIEAIKSKIRDTVVQTQPDLEVHIKEITEGLDSLAIEAYASANSQHAQPDGNSGLEISNIREKILEENRLALEAEKKAIEQSQRICTATSQ
jgi:hypothetical protein